MRLLGLLACLAAAAPVLAASHDEETVLARTTALTLEQGIAAAAAASPGRIVWAARETEDRGVVIMVEVAGEDRKHVVVTLDAMTGKVLSSTPMIPKPKADEKTSANGKKKEPAKPPAKATIMVGTATPAEYPFLAKVTMDQAIRAAAGKTKGKLVEVYVYEEGGALLYGIEISPRKGVIELVKVDAGTGAVLGHTAI